jgi:formylglycine-generating enzyme required for sulfatase activity
MGIYTMYHQKKTIFLFILLILWTAGCGGGTSSDSTQNSEQPLVMSQTPTPLLEQLALTPVTRNEDWTPIERDFDGVMMVLVPAGSFIMGSTQVTRGRTQTQCEQGLGTGLCADDGFDEVNSTNNQTFTQPFWIDKYEVSQAQFAQFNGQKANPNAFVGDNLPVESITWFEAQAFCALRGGRLPTEAEWEYVARGPNELIYPWGNEFVAENVVYSGNTEARTTPVGSIVAGASWVGALDMSGNMGEWVSSLYGNYPYDVRDEDMTDMTSNRVLRGGSWMDSDMFLPSAVRIARDPNTQTFYIGFRCVRSG